MAENTKLTRHEMMLKLYELMKEVGRQGLVDLDGNCKRTGEPLEGFRVADTWVDHNRNVTGE